MKHTRLPLLVFAAVLAAGLGSYEYSTRAQAPICGQTTECIDSEYFNSCIKTPTSLPSIDVHTSGD